MAQPLEDRCDEIVDSPPKRRGIVKSILRFLSGHFYEHTSTHTPKEHDNDYVCPKWRDCKGREKGMIGEYGPEYDGPDSDYASNLGNDRWGDSGHA